jgi:hypothetical protein
MLERNFHVTASRASQRLPTRLLARPRGAPRDSLLTSRLRVTLLEQHAGPLAASGGAARLRKCGNLRAYHPQ